LSFASDEVKSTAGLVQWGSLVFLLAGFLFFWVAFKWDLGYATAASLAVVCIISSQQLMYKSSVKVDGGKVFVSLGKTGGKKL
jgi:hypothetical protein